LAFLFLWSAKKPQNKSLSIGSEMKKTIIVVPTYNEIGNIFLIYEKIFKAVGNLNLLIVDDNSPDGTGAAADELAAKDNRVSVLHRQGKLGLGSAYIHGMKYAIENGYELIVAMDADLSHDPANLPRMLELTKEYDLVIGSRYVKDGGMVNWGVGRFFISRLANFFCKFVLVIKQQDCSGGYKCYRAELLKKIGMDNFFSFGYSFQVEILYRALCQKAKVVEFPIIFVNRHEGESKLTPSELLQFGWTVLKLRWLSWFGLL
jgi:dolichol-phosphate mannosyltransferase